MSDGIRMECRGSASPGGSVEARFGEPSGAEADPKRSVGAEP